MFELTKVGSIASLFCSCYSGRRVSHVPKQDRRTYDDCVVYSSALNEYSGMSSRSVVHYTKFCESVDESIWASSQKPILFFLSH